MKVQFSLAMQYWLKIPSRKPPKCALAILLTTYSMFSHIE